MVSQNSRGCKEVPLTHPEFLSNPYIAWRVQFIGVSSSSIWSFSLSPHSRRIAVRDVGHITSLYKLIAPGVDPLGAEKYWVGDN